MTAAPPPSFRKATWCAGGECAEVAACACGRVLVRDGALGDASPVLEFPAGAWRAFTASPEAALRA